MASHISMATDDSVKENAQTIKNHYGLSWEEFMKEANAALMPSNEELVGAEPKSALPSESE